MSTAVVTSPVNPLLPTYAIRHDTPAGPRYVIPVEPPEKAATYPRMRDSLVVAGVTSDGTEVAAEYIPGSETRAYSGEYLPGVLLAAHLLAGMIVRWAVPSGRDDWRKRPEPGGVDSLVVERWRGAPEVPADVDREHLNSDHDEDVCLTCGVLRAVYHRPELPPVQHEHRIDLPDLAILPGTPDPDPSVAWRVDDPTLITVYGRHTAHLWPGTIGGVRKAVVDALLEHPMVAPYVRTPAGHRDRYSILGNNPVYLSDHNRGRGNDVIELRVPIPWDLPLGVSPSARDRRIHGGPDRIAMEHRRTLEIPERLAAENKTEALQRLPEYVAEIVASALPAEGSPITACSSCAGKGYHLTVAGARGGAS